MMSEESKQVINFAFSIGLFVTGFMYVVFGDVRLPKENRRDSCWMTFIFGIVLVVSAIWR